MTRAVTTKPENRRRWRKVGTGLYADEFSIRAIVNCAAGRKERRFPKDTSLREMQRWREQTKVKLETLHPQKRAGKIGRGTFSAAVKAHLAGLAIGSWKSRRSELRAWEAHFGKTHRSRITTDHVKKAIKAWVAAGVPEKTILNRVRALTAMYHERDGKDAWTPADGVSLPRVRKKPPGYVSPARIRAIEQTLREQATAGARDGWRWRARFMVNSACGCRPVHLKRTQKHDVDLEQREWRVQSAKGGNPILYPLNAEQCAAWKAFIDADAWGDYDDTEYAKALRAAGWPEGIDPYALKHSFAQDMIDRDVDRETIADLFGHTDVRTTRIYSPRAKLKRVAAAAEGRLGWGADDILLVDDVGSDGASDA